MTVQEGEVLTCTWCGIQWEYHRDDLIFAAPEGGDVCTPCALKGVDIPARVEFLRDLNRGFQDV